MTEEIIIDVSNCRDKHDDDCMAMPICNEYGDLMDYQSCEAQTLCPYRTERIIDRLEQENRELKTKLSSTKCYLCGEGFLTPEGAELYEEKERYRSVLEEIREIADDAFCCCDDDCGNARKIKLIIDEANEVLNNESK